MNTRWLWLVLALGACDDGAAGAAGPDAEADARAQDAAPPPADARVGFDGGCVCEEGETCTACFERLSTCCGMEPVLAAQAPRLAARCEARTACRACCRECAALPCEVILARDQCPNGLRSPP